MKSEVDETGETKGARTERHILDTALALFRERGFEATTMRQIADAAGCSLGLTYRYFRRKEELVAALYRRLSEEFALSTERLAPGSLADRFHEAIACHRALIAPHRRTLTAVMGRAFDPESEIGVLGTGTAAIRARSMDALRTVVDGAIDAPPPHLRPAITRGLHALLLLLVLLLFQDRSRGQKNAIAAADLARDVLRLAAPMLGLPVLQGALLRVDEVLRPLLDEDPAAPRAKAARAARRPATRNTRKEK